MDQCGSDLDILDRSSTVVASRDPDVSDTVWSGRPTLRADPQVPAGARGATGGRKLLDVWLPALDGMVESLRSGAQVAQTGCGNGASAILLGQTFPATSVSGFDTHRPSIAIARMRACAAGVAGRVTFGTASADDFPGCRYDLVASLRGLHDLPAAGSRARHVTSVLAPGGRWLILDRAPYAERRQHDVIELIHQAGMVRVHAVDSSELGIAYEARL